MKYSDDFNPVDDLFDKQNSNQNNSLNTSVPNTQNMDSVIQENNESWQNNNVTNTNYNQSIIEDNMINNENINNDINDIQYNQNNNKRGFNKSIIYAIVGFILFIAVGIVITNLILKIIEQKKANEEEIAVLTDYLNVKAVGFDFDQPFDKNKFEYNLEIDTQKVQFKCNKIDSVTGCNETVNLVNKTNLDHIIEYTSQKGKKYSYTFHITKKNTNGPIKIDSIEFEKTDYSNKSTTVVVKANSDKNKKLKYSFDGGNTWQDDNKYTTDENEDVNVVIKDDAGNTTDPKEIEIDNIDTVAPTVSIEEKEKSSNKVVLFANAKDDSSGIDKYNWNESGYTNNSTYETTKAGTYTVKVKDKAGNESVKASITIPESYFKKNVKKETHTYKVTFNGNGASVSSSSSSCNIYNTAKTCNVAAPTITRSGWTILGFSTNKNATTGSTAKTLSAGKTYYAITKKNIKVTFDSKGAETIEYKSKSCTIYNSQTKCKIRIPILNKKGYSSYGYDVLGNETEWPRYHMNETYEFSSNQTLVANYLEKTSHYKNISVYKQFTLGNVLIEIDNSCSNKARFVSDLNTLYSKMPKLFSGKGKLMVLNDTLYVKSSKDTVGVTTGYDYYPAVNIKCSTSYVTIVHELTHKYDKEYNIKNGSFIANQSDVASLYNKYYSSYKANKTPFRDYTYSTKYEFLSDITAYYYAKFIIKDSGYSSYSYPNSDEALKIFKKYGIY